jgi:2-polyprenyl-6-methoxyphenol hydroxylase-like FAD-dependent oxidoreductase
MAFLPKIAIVGAGAGGLTLANVLQKHEIPFTVFEIDASPRERSQGGTLDLHPQGGQAALREAGLWDQFVKHARPESDVLKIVKNNGEVLWDGNGPDARTVLEEKKFDNRPEIDRSALKEILLAPLKPDALKWGRNLWRLSRRMTENLIYISQIALPKGALISLWVQTGPGLKFESYSQTANRNTRGSV